MLTSTRFPILSFFLGFYSVFIFGLKFRVTKQIIVAFVATALKALLPVAKTNGRLSGSKLYSGNVYYLFLTLFTHNIPQKTKSAPTEVSAPKNANSNCRQTISQ